MQKSGKKVNSRNTNAKRNNSLIKVSGQNKHIDGQSNGSRNKRNFNIVEIQKFHDQQGTSYRNKDDVQNYRTKKNTIDKTSRYGVNPAVYYDSSVDYKKQHDQITAVRPYNDRYLTNASKNATKKAQILSKVAVEEYRDEITRSKLLTKKNMAIAKVEALRVLTKAIVIEKNYYERENEIARHNESVAEIKELRKQLIEKNDVDLEYNLARLARNNEVELKNNENDYIRAKIKIEQKAEIINLKIQNEKEKIRALSRGESIRKKSMKEDVKMIKQNKSIPQNVNFETKDDSILSIIKKIKNMDMKKLTKDERGSIVKFIRLVEAYEEADKHSELVQRYEDALFQLDKKINKAMIAKNKAKKNAPKEFTVVSYDSYKKIISAKKESLLISEPAKNFEQPEVRTKVIKMKAPSKIDPTKSRQSAVKIRPETVSFEKMQPQRLDVTDLYYDKDIQKTINKFRKVVSNIARHDNFTISPYGDNAYKIKYQKMIYTKYEFRLKQKKNKQVKADDSYFNSVEYENADGSNRVRFWQKWFSGEKTPLYIKKLIKKLQDLPSDPLVVKNDGIFKSEDKNIMNVIRKLHDLEVSNEWNKQEAFETIEKAKDILNFYNELSRQDAIYRKNVMKAQVLDEKLTDYIVRKEQLIADKYSKVEQILKDKEAKINEKYAKRIENAKNDALLNAETIYEQEQKSLAKEEEQHLWNKAVSYENNNKMANEQYKYQNCVITNIVKEIEKYNKKASKPISLADVPHKILPLPVTSDARLDISVKKSGSKIMAFCTSSDRKVETAAKIVNNEMPTNVEKIYVLDKFRNIRDVKMRVAMLNEHAKNIYNNAAKFNESREKKELEIAEKRLNKKLKEVDGIYQDASLLTQVANRMKHIVEERDFVQNQYQKIKKEKWKIYDKDEKLKEKILKLQTKQEELEMLRVQKEADRNKKQFEKLSRKNKQEELDYKEVIGKR